MHARTEPGRFATTEAHIHEHKRHGVERGATYWLDRCRLIGPSCARWAEALNTQRGAYAIRSLQGLVSLTKTHPADAIEQAADAAEQRASFMADALAARQHMLVTGEGFDSGGVHAYLKARIAGGDAVKPKPKPWQG